MLRIIHDLPRMHQNASNLSFSHFQFIQRYAKDILGQKNIGHVSVNVAPHDSGFFFLSSTPELGINLLKNGYLTVDGSTSPTYYKSKQFFTWADTYNPLYRMDITKFKLSVHGLSSGAVFVFKNLMEDYLMLSIGTRADPDAFEEGLSEDKAFYSESARYLFNWFSPLIHDICGINSKNELLVNMSDEKI